MMIRKYLLPVLAVVGIGFAIFVVVQGAKVTPASPPVAQPSMAPFDKYIAGAGIVESSTEDIQIGTPVAGIVTAIPVKVGSNVKTGDPLFQIDDRELEAELAVRQANLRSAQEELKVEQANLADDKNKWQMWQNILDKQAVSKEEIDDRRFAVEKSQAAEAKAEADVQLAQAQIAQTQIDIERRIVRAPVDGQVLQIKVHLGEFAPANVVATPLVIVGNVDTLHVRTDIDENDAWRLNTSAEAVAYVRGNNALHTKLHFVRVEPYVVPKKSLTGDSTERVDTRVLQVLYSFDRKTLPVYVGQQMDVFIRDLSSATTEPAR